MGVTRLTQIPTRWIDQGAHEALAFMEAPNRYLAGITEVALKDHVADKTNWRKMLTNDVDDRDLKSVFEELRQYVPKEAQPYILDNTETHIEFPVQDYPEKVKSVSLEKTPEFTGKLTGIKGQYLLFDGGQVMNVRNHSGYVVDLHIK